MARIRSIISRIFRRLALWSGSDKPTPRGGVLGSSPIIDNTSGVVAKEPIDEVEEVLLLGGLGDIGPRHFQQSSFYRHPDKDIEPRREVWRDI